MTTEIYCFQRAFAKLPQCSAVNSYFVAFFLSLFVLISNSHPVDAQSFGGGAFKGMSDNKEPIQIEADRLEVIDGDGVAVFDGNVSVVQGSTVLKTTKLKVFYIKPKEGEAKPDANNAGGNIKKIEASGKVAVRSGDQQATADSAIVDMQSQIATLSGNVAVSQGETIVTGCNLRINMKTNAANLTPCKGANTSGGGRVKMLLTPQSGEPKKKKQ